jgi:hypothetical protein
MRDRALLSQLLSSGGEKCGLAAGFDVCLAHSGLLSQADSAWLSRSGCHRCAFEPPVHTPVTPALLASAASASCDSANGRNVASVSRRPCQRTQPRSSSTNRDSLPKRPAFGLSQPAFFVARERRVVPARDVPAEETPDCVALADALRRAPAAPTGGVVEPRDTPRAGAGHARILRRPRCLFRQRPLAGIGETRVQMDARSASAAACRRALTSASSRAARSMRSCCVSVRSRCWSARSC